MDIEQPAGMEQTDYQRKDQQYQQLPPQQQQQQQVGHHADFARLASLEAIPRSQSLHRPTAPTRSSTVGTPDELERKQEKSGYNTHPHARSEDFNHSQFDTLNVGASPSGGAVLGLQPLSRPITPNDSRSGASSSAHSENGGDDSTLKRLSVTSLSSAAPSAKAASSISGVTGSQQPQPPGTVCAACSLPLEGAFVRALGNVWHLPCFKCRVSVALYFCELLISFFFYQECDVVVASKFFPIEGPDGKQQPLCERDYFGRLNLICAKCQQALRGSYITACSTLISN